MNSGEWRTQIGEMEDMAARGGFHATASVVEIENGWLVAYKAPYETFVPSFPNALGAPPSGAKRMWSVKAITVYCATSEAVQAEIGKALETKQRIKEFRAQDVLTGDVEVAVAI